MDLLQAMEESNDEIAKIHEDYTRRVEDKTLAYFRDMQDLKRTRDGDLEEPGRKRRLAQEKYRELQQEPKGDTPGGEDRENARGGGRRNQRDEDDNDDMEVDGGNRRDEDGERDAYRASRARADEAIDRSPSIDTRDGDDDGEKFPDEERTMPKRMPRGGISHYVSKWIPRQAGGYGEWEHITRRGKFGNKMFHNSHEDSHVCGFFNGTAHGISRREYTEFLEQYGKVVAIVFATLDGAEVGYMGHGYVQYSNAGELRRALGDLRGRGVRLGGRELRMDPSRMEFDLERLIMEDCTQHRMPRVSIFGSAEIMHGDAGGWRLTPDQWEAANLE